MKAIFTVLFILSLMPFSFASSGNIERPQIIQLCKYNEDWAGPGVWPLKLGCQNFAFHKFKKIDVSITKDFILIITPSKSKNEVYHITILDRRTLRPVYVGYGVSTNDRYLQLRVTRR